MDGTLSAKGRKTNLASVDLSVTVVDTRQEGTVPISNAAVNTEVLCWEGCARTRP